MATSAIPALIDELVARATTALPDVIVIDGDDPTDDSRDALFIGIEDPDDEKATAARAQQEWPHIGHSARDQSGEILCAALAWNGNTSVKQARDAAYAMTAAIEDFLRAEPDLGLRDAAGVMWTGFGTREELIQFPTTSGATALLIFSIAFQARI